MRFKSKMAMFALRLFLMTLVFSGACKASAAIYYIDATSGNDSNDGLSQETAWQTLPKVNGTSFSPGDNILFKRGEAWNIGEISKISTPSWPAVLVPSSGTAENYITYGSYGSGEKPLITATRNKNDLSDWIDEGGNIWSTSARASGTELSANPSFDSDTTGWGSYFYSGNGASGSISRTTVEGEYDSAPGGLKMTITGGGTSGSDIQLNNAANMSIIQSHWYKLSFHAKATNAFNFDAPRWGPVVFNGSNLSSISPYVSTISTDWKNITLYYKANATASNAQLKFYFGGVPSDTTVYLDSFSFQEVPGEEVLFTDVANIIADQKTVFGTKVWSEAALDTQGDFWYDIENKKLKMYSVGNPATYYNGDVKLVMRVMGVDYSSKSYVIFDGLHISMANVGFDAYHDTGPNDVIIKNCDISYMGGADQNMDGVSTVRNGGGLGLEKSGHDITWENNRIWEIYDAAISPQSYGSVAQSVYNIFVRNNLIWNSEYGIEYWQRPTSTVVSDVYFENNTIVDTGRGWAHNQRPDGVNGRGLLISTSDASETNIFFRNNLYYNSSESLIRFRSSSTGPNEPGFNIDHNYYFNSLGNNYLISDSPGAPVSNLLTNQIDSWQSAASVDLHSIADFSGNIFANKSAQNYDLTSNSQAIDSGIDTDRTTDYAGNPIYGTPDIGAYEYQPPHTMVTDKIDIQAGARIYCDGKFRDLQATSSNTANLSITPQSGSFNTYGATQIRPQWMDITDITWINSFNYHKSWTESSTIASNTLHVVGDLAPNRTYDVRVDSVLGQNIQGINGTTCTGGVCQSNSQGEIYFLYTGSYSTHTFDVVMEGDFVPPNMANGLVVN